MPGLVDELRAALGEPDAPSFRLHGEDLTALTPARLRAAAESWERALDATVPPALQGAVLAEHDAHAREAHGWVRRWNRSLERRVQGYVELGRRFSPPFLYPWPVVAILGIRQVAAGLGRSRVHGLVARPLAKAGLPELGRIVDAGDDLLRRTNRGIFADSVPVVLWGLRAHALCNSGRQALAEALLAGPPPLLMDEECVALASALCQGLAREGRARFDALAALTLRHFGREQQVFSHHLGRAHRDREGWLARRIAGVRQVPAPRIEGGRLVVRPFALPTGFDMRDHAARVAAFGDAFVRSVTKSPDDYAVAVRAVLDEWG